MVYPDGAQRDLFEHRGHPPEGMEGLFETNDCRADCRTAAACFLFFLA